MIKKKSTAKPKPKLGTGQRFKNLTDKLQNKGMSKNEAGAIAANAGRAKYGNKKMAKMSAAGRKKKK